jgi:hypothetical protein
MAALKVKTTGVVAATPVAPLAGLLVTVALRAKRVIVRSATTDKN